MSSCSIKWCGKTSKTSNYHTDGITFHRFPKDPDIKDAWIKATMRENWFPRNFSVVCSRHFTSDCFDKLKNRRRLFSSAVPTRLLPLLGSPEDKAASDDEKPSTSVTKARESTNDNSVIDGNEPNSKHILESNDLLIKSTNSTSKKALVRKNTELIMKLRKTRLVIKRLQDSNRQMKKKVNTFKGLIEKLKNKEFLSQDNIDINRLQNSNKQLRKKVVWLKKLLIEQKKKNLTSQHNVVWCPAADEALVRFHI